MDNTWPTDGLSFGGDYNPEQWDPSVWREDMTLMREVGVNLVSLGIFSWGPLEVADGEYDWAWFDEIVDLLEENDIAIDLATPTAAPPGWLLHAPRDAGGRPRRREALAGWTGTDWSEHGHADHADVLARYAAGPLSGAPAVTSRTFPPGGRAIYVSAGLDSDSIAALARSVVPSIDEPDLSQDVEMLVRESDAEAFAFFINHSPVDVGVAGTGVDMLTDTDIVDVLDVPGGAVRVLRRPRT